MIEIKLHKDKPESIIFFGDEEIAQSVVSTEFVFFVLLVHLSHIFWSILNVVYFPLQMLFKENRNQQSFGQV